MSNHEVTFSSPLPIGFRFDQPDLEIDTMTAKPRPTDPAALREQERTVARNGARLRERIRLMEGIGQPRPTSPPRAESPAERQQRLQARENVLLLSYCQGDAELVAEVRKDFTPEQITDWIAFMETEGGWSEKHRLAEYRQHTQASEDALLLNYCEGNTELAAEVRKTIDPELITAWIAAQ